MTHTSGLIRVRVLYSLYAWCKLPGIPIASSLSGGDFFIKKLGGSSAICSAVFDEERNPVALK